MRNQFDVLDECTGWSRFGWSMAHWMYRAASSGRVVGTLYERIRSNVDHNKPSFSRWLLGHQLQRRFGCDTTPLIVSHPTVVGILSGRNNLIYQHGELVAPRESLVKGAVLVCVPTPEVADVFCTAGYPPESILITGLCIEPQLVKFAPEMFSRRLTRLESTAGLCGGFFSSGAEPDAHVTYLATAALSVVQNGGRAVIFAVDRGKLAGISRRLFFQENISLNEVSTDSAVPHDLPPATLVTYKTRRDLDTLTALLFPHLDYFVSPAHERVNWAVGLGLPMIALEPTTGPFAPLNLKLVCEQGVAVRSHQMGRPSAFHWNLDRLKREGGLSRVAEAGWNRHPIAGFDTIADALIERFSIAGSSH